MLSVTSQPGNLASVVLDRARVSPERAALVSPLEREPVLTFGALADRVARLRRGLARRGVRPGDRVLVLAPLGVDFVATALAVFASGATLVTLDGQLGARRVLGAISVARPRAVVSLRHLLRLWPLVPSLVPARRFAVDGAGFGVRPLSELADAPPDLTPPVPATAPAMISFSSGTGGRPKGAERTHQILFAQHRALRRALPFADGAVDLPAFPAVTLHNLACGITTVLPPVDLRHPARVDATAVLDCARRFGVTSLSGAPAYLSRLAEHALAAGVELPALERVVVGGAPVSRKLCRTLAAAFPAAERVVIYGSTEAEPMTHVSADEVARADGAGFLVGAADPAAELELVRLPAVPPPGAGDRMYEHRVADGEVGEVVVRGRHVVQRYVGDAAAQRANKLPSRDGVWHRTGDLARRDARGRLWLAGRAGDLLPRDDGARHPFDVEAVVLDCAPVRACALVATPRHPTGVLAVELVDGAGADALDVVRDALTARALPALPILTVDEIPMDARHQSKADRLALRARLIVRKGGIA
jgi:olefin beta-lactone synthetase